MPRPLPIMKPQNRYRFDRIHEAIAMAAKSIGIEVAAAALEKSPGTLRGELVVTRSSCNPMKLGFDDAISIMLMSGDLTPIHMVADLLDHVLIPRDAEKNMTPAEVRLLRLAGMAGQLTHVVTKILEDGVVTDDERREAAPLLKNFERLLAAELASLGNE